MNFLLIILGIILTVLFFLNIKSAATLLCRILGGFLLLLIYNSLSQAVSLPSVGINLITAVLCGFLEIPGLGLVICCHFFL